MKIIFVIVSLLAASISQASCDEVIRVGDHVQYNKIYSATVTALYGNGLAIISYDFGGGSSKNIEIARLSKANCNPTNPLISAGKRVIENSSGLSGVVIAVYDNGNALMDYDSGGSANVYVSNLTILPRIDSRVKVTEEGS